MNLKTYQEFLLESLLLTSNPLYDLIKKIDDPVAQKFAELVNKDIKTKYNLIDLTDTNDKLAFMPDSQATTKIKSGQNPIDLFGQLPNKTTIGRVIRGILKDNNIEFTESQIEKFVNKFKSSYDAWKIASEKKEPIKVVRGEDIRYWYLDKNYCQETLDGKGSLGKSCMRYERCQNFLDIYVNNPEQVGLVIYLDDNEKLRSRALLWETDKGQVLDRIYYTNDSDVNLIQEWVINNFKFTPKNSYNKKVILTGVSNKDGSYDYYPYMDQFMYYYVPEKTLYNFEPNVTDRQLLLELQDTAGFAHSMDSIYCEVEDESYPSSEVVWSEYAQSYMHVSNAVYSNYESDHIWSESAVYSEWMSDYLIHEKSAKVFLDVDGKDCDWYTEDSEDIFLDVITGDYYISSLAVEDDFGKITLEKYIYAVYVVQKDSIDRYRELYNISSHYSYYHATEVDEKIFGINLDKSNKIRMYNKNYFESYWTRAILDKIEKQIPENLEPWQLKYDKEKEIEQADDILSKTNKLFVARNSLYRLGGVDQFLVLWKDVLNERFDEQFKQIVSSQYIERAKRSPLEKLIQSISIDNLKKFVNKSLTEPEKFFLAFGQNNKKDNDKELSKIISEELHNQLEFDKVTDITFEQCLDIVEYITLLLYRNIGSYARWSSYQGIRWFDILDLYLKQQDDFKDIKQ